jgi:hypothetical protein
LKENYIDASIISEIKKIIKGAKDLGHYFLKYFVTLTWQTAATREALVGCRCLMRQPRKTITNVYCC